MSFPQAYQGWSSYRSDIYVGPHRLFIAVPCIIGDPNTITDGLLDTAAEWCVLSSEVAASLDFGLRMSSHTGWRLAWEASGAAWSGSPFGSSRRKEHLLRSKPHGSFRRIGRGRQSSAGRDAWSASALLWTLVRSGSTLASGSGPVTSTGILPRPAALREFSFRRRI